MKMCILTPGYPRWKGDVSSAKNYLHTLPKSLVNKGAEAHVIAPHTGGRRSLNQELMERYLSLFDGGGKLILIQNSDLTGVVRRTNIKIYLIEELRSFFGSLNCCIEKIYFYDRHIIGRFLHSFVFNISPTGMHISIPKITKLPCNIVFIVSKGYSD